MAAAALVLVVTAVLPLVWLLGRVELSGISLLLSARTWVLLGKSVLLSTAVTVLALGIGAPLGVLIGRTDVAGRQLLWLLHAFSMFLPPFLLGLGWIHVFGHGSAAALLFSPFGLVLTLACAFSPVMTSLIALGVMGIDASYEEAARLSARPYCVATRILLPLVRPAITLGIVVVFALALSELGVPMLLRVDVFPAAVFARLGGVAYAPGEAFALVLPLVPVVVGLLIVERRLAGRRTFAVLGLARARAPIPLGRWRVPVSVAAWAFVLGCLAPIVGLLVRSGFGSPFEWAGDAPWNTLFASTLSASGIVLVGAIAGYGGARRLPGAALLDAVAVLAFVTPASVLAVGLVAVWNRPSTELVYRTSAILVLAYVARYAIIGSRIVASTVAQVPVHLEEAAAVSGASFIRRLSNVVVPLNVRGLAFAWLFSLLFCMRDVETVALFYPPGGEPLTVRIFTLEANGPEAIVSGLAVLQVAMTAGVLALGAVLLPRSRV